MSAYQTSGYAYQGAGLFAYQGGTIPPTPSTGGGWPPVLVGNKKGKRKAKRLIDEIREAVQALYAKDDDVGIIKADAIITEIREIIPTVDKFPELLQQLIHLEQRVQAYMRDIDDDDDDFYFLM